MNATRLYLDTDVVSELALHPRREDVTGGFRRGRIEPVISDTLVQEVLLTSDKIRRRKVADMVLRLLGSRQLLAPVAHQIRWSCRDFLAGVPKFVPYQTDEENEVRSWLCDPDVLDDDSVANAFASKQKEASSWDEMHAKGRRGFDELMQKKGGTAPSASEWLELIDGEFVRDFVGSIVPQECRAELRSRESEFLRWNPLLRAHVEQLLLAIHRHAVDAPNAASKKGPKWPDYSHGAFVVLADLIATNDARFRRALETHSTLGSVGNFAVTDLDGVIRAALDGSSLARTRSVDFSWRRVQAPHLDADG